MYSLLRRMASGTGAGWLLALAAIIVIGCRGISPFLAAEFNTTLLGRLPFGSAPPTTRPSGTGADDVLETVCDLPVAQRGISVAIQNQAQQTVRFGLVFVASAGPGGFVCDSEVQNYINAGYQDVLPPGQNTFTIGCDTLTLLSGTRLLALGYGVNQSPEANLIANPTDDPNSATTLTLRRRDNGGTVIPLPEVIVMGSLNTNDPAVVNTFICSADLCTQRGFVYVSNTNLPIGKAAEASRIQGTICQTGFGTAPEWRLDRTLTDNQTRPFQYPAGGSLLVTVLNRASDPVDTRRNQVVWLVTNAAGNTIHIPQP